MFKENVFGGEEPRLAKKREQIQQLTMQETGVYTQLSDGSVPSFEKFKAVKQKIQNSNKNARLSPLTQREKQQQTIDEYMKLEQMVNDKTRERVRALQAKLPQEDLPLELQSSSKALEPIFMSKDGEAGTLETLKPQQNMVFSTDGTPASEMPFDIVNKSVAEIKEMGFEELGVVGQQQKPRKIGRPQRLQAHEREELRRSLTELQGGFEEAEGQDEGFHVDDLQDKSDRATTVTTKSYHGPSESQMKKLQMQRKIDSARIAVVYEALDKGIELKDNDLYNQMLQEYPVYQKKLSMRKKALNTLERLAKMQDSKSKSAKYKFEQKYLPSQKSGTEVQATTDEQQSAHEKYQALLKEYEDDLAEIRAKEKDIPL